MRASGSPSFTFSGGAADRGRVVVLGTVATGVDAATVVTVVGTVVGAGVVAMMSSNCASSLFWDRASWMPVPHSWYTTKPSTSTPRMIRTRPSLRPPIASRARCSAWRVPREAPRRHQHRPRALPYRGRCRRRRRPRKQGTRGPHCRFRAPTTTVSRAHGPRRPPSRRGRAARALPGAGRSRPRRRAGEIVLVRAQRRRQDHPAAALCRAGARVVAARRSSSGATSPAIRGRSALGSASSATPPRSTTT